MLAVEAGQTTLFVEEQAMVDAVNVRLLDTPNRNNTRNNGNGRSWSPLHAA